MPPNILILQTVVSVVSKMQMNQLLQNRKMQWRLTLLVSLFFSMLHNSNAQSCDAAFRIDVVDNLVSFTDTSRNLLDSAYVSQWEFGDSSYSTAALSTQHAYPRTGVYQVKLIIASAAPYCYDSLVKTVVVTKMSTTPVCPAQIIPSSNAQSNAVRFQGKVRNGDLLLWKLDNKSRTDTSFNYTFPTRAPFQSVKLVVRNSGCKDSSSLYIFRHEVMCENTFVSRRSEDSIDSFEFYQVGIKSSWLGVANHTWDFGDGNTSTELHPKHNYSTSGSYQVCHEITDPKGRCTIKKCEVVKTCEANFESEAVEDNGFRHTLKNTSLAKTGYTSKWLLPIDDYQVSTERSPTATFPGLNSYSVGLIIQINACIDTLQKEVVVNEEQEGCKAQFDVDINGSTARFINRSLSSGPQLFYSWDFGNSRSSTERNPVIDYRVKGNYLVRLRVTNNQGSLTDSISALIRIPEDHKTCKAEFQLAVDTTLKYTLFAFDKSVNAYSYEWAFGDSQTSEEPYPTHQYENVGYYRLCLTVRNGPGVDSTCVDTYCDSFLVDSTGHIGWKKGFTLIVKPSTFLNLTETSTAAIRAYPVPFSSVLHVTSPFTTGTLSVFSASGQQMLFEENITESGLTLDTHKWPSGLYVLRLQNEQTTIHQKIIKH